MTYVICKQQFIYVPFGFHCWIVTLSISFIGLAIELEFLYICTPFHSASSTLKHRSTQFIFDSNSIINAEATERANVRVFGRLKDSWKIQKACFENKACLFSDSTIKCLLISLSRFHFTWYFTQNKSIFEVYRLHCVTW